MNLRPAASGRPHPRFPRPAAPSRWTTMVGLALVGVALGAGLLEERGLERREAAAEQELDRIRRLAGERERAAGELADARDALSRTVRLERRLDRWLEERELLAGLLRGVARRLGPDVVLETLQRQGAGFTITGQAVSDDAVSATARDLGRLGPVLGLDLLYVEQIEGSPGSGAAAGDSGGADQRSPRGAAYRFALEGTLGYVSPEPEPFEVVVPTGLGGEAALR